MRQPVPRRLSIFAAIAIAVATFAVSSCVEPTNMKLTVAKPTSTIVIERVRSPGGIESWLVQDDTVPIISMSFSFAGAAAIDPPGKEGLADMVSSLLDEGAGELDSKAFQRALEDISASISFDAGRERFRGSLRTLSRHRDAGFQLLSLAVNSPRFDPKPVERIRAQLIASLMSQQENPRRIAGRTWYSTVFPSHPYGKPVAGTTDSIKAIKRSDLNRFTAERFGRDNLLIGVVGDITSDELGRRLDEVFAGLAARSNPVRVTDVRPDGAGKLVIVRKKIPQSVVVFGQRGIKRDDKDYYAAYVMNYILGGGGFSSRLTEEIREKRGLAYSVYSYLNPLDHAGLIMGGLGTRNDRVATSLKILRAEWARIAHNGVSDEELRKAKTYINGSFPLRLDSSRSIANLLVAIQVSKLGIDYLDRRPELIDAVSRDQVRLVARRLLEPNRLTVVVVGDPKDLETKP
jgi:zinc protease